MKKIVSILSLILVFGCQKQIQLSNGKVIYQPYGKTETIQNAQSNNVEQSENGTNNPLNAVGNLVAPATAGAIVASDAIGNTSGDGFINNQPANSSSNAYGNATSNDLENAVNNSFGGKTQESAPIGNNNNLNSFGKQTSNSSVPQSVNTASNTQSYTQQAQSYTPSATANTASNVALNTTSAVNNVAQSAPQNYTLQVGNYANANTANKIASSLKAKGYSAQVVKSGSTNKVVVGDYITKASGSATKAELTALGYAGIFFTTLGE